MVSNHKNHDYHLVDPSPWPIIGSASACLMFVGLVLFMHNTQFANINVGHILLPLGFILVLFTMFVWWRDVIKEGINGKHHTKIVQYGLRIGMALFILSEIMFFFAFFWAFFKYAVHPVDVIKNGTSFFEDGVQIVKGVWPPVGIKTFDPWDLPFINTLVLLLSGTTVTWAHYGLMNNDRKALINGLILTVILGISFTCLQILEYHHASFGFKDGIYSSVFYMSTGFHGAHVLIGTIFLLICLIRASKGQMDADNHLGFEFAAWYWHFVDVVWIFLFAFVYIWGA